MKIPVVVAMEASAPGRQGYPIEVGYSHRHGDGWCTLIRPEPDWTCWDEQTARHHHISRDILDIAGRTSPEITALLNLRLSGLTVYTEAGRQGRFWMDKLFAAAGVRPVFQLAEFREILTPAQRQIWHVTRIQVERELHLTRNRASNQARISQLTWLRTWDTLYPGS